MKKAVKVLVIIIGSFVALTIGMGLGMSIVATTVQSGDQQIDVVKNTTEETIELSSESTEVYEELTSSIEESTTDQTEYTTEDISSTEEIKTGFTYTGSDGIVFNSIEELQQWIYDYDRSISSFEEVYQMSTEELIERYEYRVELDNELNETYLYDDYDDYGDEGFWDDEEGMYSDITINSAADYKNWFRNCKEDDEITITSLADTKVVKVFGNNEQLIVGIWDNIDSYAYFYLDSTDGNIPNVIAGDKIQTLSMTYSGNRSEDDGMPLFYCSSISLY